LVQINTDIADKATEMSPMGSIDPTGRITDLAQAIGTKEDDIKENTKKLRRLRFQAAKAQESRNAAKKALESLTKQITAETTNLDRTTAMINAAASAAMKAKQDSAETEEAITNNKEDFDQVAAKHKKVIEQLNLKGASPNKTAMMEKSLSENKKRLNLLTFAYASAQNRLTDRTDLKATRVQDAASLNSELGDLKTKQTDISRLNTEWDQLNTNKSDETRRHLGEVSTHDGIINSELGKENDLNRYAQKGLTNTTNIVAYEMASAVERYAGQHFQQTLSSSPNELEKVITGEGEDAILLAQTMNIKPDELGIASGNIPNPTNVKKDLLIELIEAKLSVSKNM
jgi:chromosome segregation ATPase